MVAPKYQGHLIAYSISKGIDGDGKYNSSLATGDQNNLKTTIQSESREQAAFLVFLMIYLN